MKEPNLMEKGMDTGPFFTVKVENMLENGLKTRCTEKEPSTIQAKKSLIKVNGKTISSVVMGSCIMKK